MYDSTGRRITADCGQSLAARAFVAWPVSILDSR